MNPIEGNQFGKLLRHGSGYFVVSVFTKFAAFLLLPIITRYLTTDEYGLYSNIQSLQRILYVLGSIGVDAAYARFVYDFNDSSEKLRRLTSATVTALMLWGLVFVGLSSIGALHLIAYWAGYRAIAISLMLPIIGLSQVFSALNIALMKSRHHTRRLLALTAGTFLGTQFLTILLLVSFRIGVEAIVLAQLIGNGVALILHFRHMSKQGIIELPRWDWPVLRRLLGYGVAYVPAAISSWVFLLSDRYVITHFESLSVVGKYALLTQFAMLVQVVMDAVNNAYMPIFMGLMKRLDSKDRARVESYYSVLVYVLFLLHILISLTVPYAITLLFPSHYHGDAPLLSLLTLGFVFLALRKMYANVLVYYKKTSWISITGYLPAAINVLLNLWLVPKYGIYAAAVSTLISFAAYFFTVFGLSQKLVRLSIDFRTMIVAPIIAVAIGFVGQQLHSFVYKIAMVIGYLLLGYLFGVHTLVRSDRRADVK